MRKSAIACLMFAAVVFGGLQPARGSCAPPTVSFRPFIIEPGRSLTIEGSGWTYDCPDSVGVSACGAEEPGPPTPAEGISVRLRSLDDRKADDVELGEVDADSELRFTLRVSLPGDVAPGRYRVVAEDERANDVLVVER